MDSKQNRHTWIATLAATLLLLGALAWLLWRSGFFQAAHTVESLQAYIGRFAPYSHLVFFLLQLTSVILAPIPSNLTAAAGGLLVGTLPAFLLTAAAVVLGSVIVFQLSRTLGRPFADRFLGQGFFNKYGEVIRKKRDLFLFLAFLFPFFPDDLLCILAGLTQISFRRFLLLILLARPWGLLAACALGGSALHLSPLAMALLGIAGVILFLLALKYSDRLEQYIIDKLKRS